MVGVVCVMMSVCISGACFGSWPADFNMDGTVNFQDMVIFSYQWLRQGEPDPNDMNDLYKLGLDEIYGRLGSWPTFVIAASDAPNSIKNKADYICDGLDDQVEINTLIDSMPNSGACIQFTNGTFWVTDKIHIYNKSNIALIGCNGTTLLSVQKSTTLDIDAEIGATSICVADVNGFRVGQVIKISDGLEYFDTRSIAGIDYETNMVILSAGDYPNESGGLKHAYSAGNSVFTVFDIIKIEGASFIALAENISILNLTIDGDESNMTRHITFDGGEYYSDYYQNGIRALNTINLTIADCSIINIVYNSILLHRGYCKNANICNNYISSTTEEYQGRGIAHEAIDINFKITNNVIIAPDSAGKGIYLCSGTGASGFVSGNYVEGYSDGLYAFSDANNIKVANNTFKYPSENAIRLVSSAGNYWNIDNNRIIGSKGIFTQGISYVTITNNILTDIMSGHSGMRIHFYNGGGEHNVITGNIITGGTFLNRAIDCSTLHTLIANNIIDTNCNYCIGPDKDPSQIDATQYTDVFAEILAEDVNKIVVCEDIHAFAGGETCTIVGQPDVARNVTLDVSTGNITAFSIIVKGINAWGDTVEENFESVNGFSQTGEIAFISISEVEVDSIMGPGTGDILNVGIGSKLGLTHAVYENKNNENDVYKVEKNGVNYPSNSYDVNLANNTVDVSKGGPITSGDDFTISYRSSLNILRK